MNRLLGLAAIGLLVMGIGCQKAKEQTVTSRIIMFGDSQTELVDWTKLFPSAYMVNCGISGNSVSQLRSRIQSVVDLTPCKIFLMIGINDLTTPNGEALDIGEGVVNVVGLLRDALPITEIYVQSILPINSERLVCALETDQKIVSCNDIIRQRLKGKNKIFYLDLYSKFVGAAGVLSPAYDRGDGLHLSSQGYLLWRDIISPYVMCAL